jgi:hypothetical protein
VVKIILSGAFLLIVGLLVGGVVIQFAADSGGSTDSQCFFSGAKNIADLGPIIWYAMVLVVGAGLIGYSVFMAKSGRLGISLLIGGALLGAVALGQPSVAEAAGDCLFADGSVQATSRIGYSDGTFVSKSATITVCASTANSLLSCDYVADGVNDEEQIRAAMDDCPLAGCHVYLSEGTFRIGEPASMPTTAIFELKSNMQIRGAGKCATRLVFDDERGVAPTDRYMFGTGSGEGAYAIQKASISDLCIFALDASDHGLQIKGVQFFRVQNVGIHHNEASQSADEGIQISSNDGDDVDNVDLVNVHITGFGADGIEIAAGDVPYSTSNIRVWGMVSEENNAGLGTRSKATGLYIYGGSFSNNTLSGMSFTDSRNILISGANASGNGRHGIDANSVNSTDLHIRDCVLQDNDRYGVALGGSRQSVDGCLILNNGADYSLSDESLRAGVQFNGLDSQLSNNQILNDPFLVVVDETGTVSCVETNNNAAVDDTGAVFSATIRDGNHVIQVKDTGGEVVTGFIGTADVGGDDTEIAVFNSAALTTQNWVGGGASAFDCTATPLTYSVFTEDHGNQLSGIRVENGATGEIRDNDFGDAFASHLDLHASAAHTFAGSNRGVVNKNSGTATILNTATSIAVTHGLSVTPAAGECWFLGAENPSNTPGAHWIDTYTATQFTANVENDPGASNYDIVWFCDVR